MYSTLMKNSDIYLLSATLCSFLSLDDIIGDFIKLSCSLSLSPRNPRHTTKTAPISPFSIHWMLMFVNAVNKDAAVGRFRAPAAGANET